MQGVKPTRDQRKLLVRSGLDTYDYLVLKVYVDKILCLERSSSKKVYVFYDKKDVEYVVK